MIRFAFMAFLACLVGCSSPELKKHPHRSKELAPRYTFKVGQEGMATITSALALCKPGTTLVIPAGTYSSSSGEVFPLLVPKGVRVMGVLGKTIIDVDTPEPTDALYLESGVTVQGLTFKSTTNNLGWCLRSEKADDIFVSHCSLPNRQGVSFTDGHRIELKLLIFSGQKKTVVSDLDIQAGIFLKRCRKVRLLENTILRQEACAFFSDCEDVLVRENIFGYSDAGLKTRDTKGLVVKENNLWRCARPFYDMNKGSFAAEGNLAKNPHFVHTSSLDFRLMAFSPCIKEGRAWGAASIFSPETVLALSHKPQAVESVAEHGSMTPLINFVAVAGRSAPVRVMPSQALMFVLRFDDPVRVARREMYLSMTGADNKTISMKATFLVQDETEIAFKVPTGIIIPAGERRTFELSLNTMGLPSGVTVTTSLYGVQWMDGKTEIETVLLAEKKVRVGAPLIQKSKEF